MRWQATRLDPGGRGAARRRLLVPSLAVSYQGLRFLWGPPTPLSTNVVSLEKELAEQLCFQCPKL